jgi:SAM-dependent methyltransferase
VIGIEYDERVIAKTKTHNPDVPVELGNVLSLRYPDNSFDAYISLGVIEHFEGGPQAALKEGWRILKPNGIAFITTPYLNLLRRVVSHPVRSMYFALRRLRGRKNYFWEYRFTRRELESYVKEAGFELIETRVEDYERTEKARHIGLWADWPFLRNKNGEIWELNGLGKGFLKFMKLFPASWYSGGIAVVAKARKN